MNTPKFSSKIALYYNNEIMIVKINNLAYWWDFGKFTKLLKLKIPRQGSVDLAVWSRTSSLRKPFGASPWVRSGYPSGTDPNSKLLFWGSMSVHTLLDVHMQIQNFGGQHGIPQRANPSALPPSFWDHIQGRSQSKPHLLIGSVSHKRFGEPETWGPSLASQGPSSKTAGTEALAGGEQWRGLGPHLEQDINTIERRTVHIAQLNTKDHTCDLNPQSLDFEEHEQGHWFSNLLGWTEVKYVRHSNKITKIIITNNLFELSFGPFRWELDGRMHVHAEHKKVCHHPWSLRCWRRHTGHRHWSKHSVHWGKSHTTSSIWPVLPTCCEPPTPLQLLPPRPWVPGLRISERAGWCLTAWFT